MKNVKQPNGYERIGLSRDGNREYLSVHRLIWEAFNGRIPDGMQIDHINGIKNDNRLSNLRCVSSKENVNNPVTREYFMSGMKKRSDNEMWQVNHRESTRKSCNKPILQLDKDTGEVIREWECAADVERELELHRGHISECCNGKLKSAGGFKWEFV